MISPASRAPIAASGSSSNRMRAFGVHRARHRDGLTLAAGQLFHRQIDRRHVHADLFETLRRALPHGAIVQQAKRPPTHDLPVQEHVVIDAQRIGQRQVLIDAFDAERARVIDRAQRRFLAADTNSLPLVG